MKKLFVLLYVIGLLVFGTITSLFAKLVYQLKIHHGDAEEHFDKPWAMTTLMFAGMTFLLPYALIQGTMRAKQQNVRKNSEEDGQHMEPLLESSHMQNKSSDLAQQVKQTLMIGIPTVFDLIATLLMNIGLLATTASVYQILRGAEMLFAALFAVLFLKRKLNIFHFMGIASCVIGISIVGVASVMSTEPASPSNISPQTQTHALIGIGLIVLSQAIQAAQVTYEDFFMSDLSIEPASIVSFEGLFGVLMMVGIMLPIAQVLPTRLGAGIHEDTLGTLEVIKDPRNKLLVAVLAIDVAALALYNLNGMQVTSSLGGVHRTVLETMRTVFVWIINLGLYYGLPETGNGGRIGEAWTAWSWMQLAGFVVLVVGTFLYGHGQNILEKSYIEPEPPATSEVDEYHTHTPRSSQQEHYHTSEPIPFAHPFEAPYAQPSSYKSTMSLTSTSFNPRSFIKSDAGSYHANRYSFHDEI